MSTFVYPKFKAFAANGSPLSLGYLYTLSAGTTWPVGAKNTFVDKAMTAAANNPVELDANGEALVYGVGQYKMILADANGNQLWTVDNIDGIGTSTNFQSISSYGLSLANANANMAANGGYLLIDQPVTVTANTTIANSIVLGFVKCAYNGNTSVNITVNTGVVLTINSPFTPPPFQCFTGGGVVGFGPNALTSLMEPPGAVCWGGGAVGATAANTAAAGFIGTLTVNSPTPDVSTGMGVYTTENTSTTTITGFANAVAGQTWTVIVGDANTGFGGANIVGSPGAVGVGGALQFVYDGANTHVISPPPVGMYRNLLINGEMRIDNRQGGVSYTVSANTANYTIDRWYLASSNSSMTVQQIPGSGQWKNFLQLQGAANNAMWQLLQRVEANLTNPYANATMTFSAYIYASSNMAVTWSIGSAISTDTWSSNLTVASNTWNVTANLTRYTATFNAGANAPNGLQVSMSGSNFTSGSLYVTGCQLEAGGSATQFERRPDDVENLRCQRYYPFFNNTGTAGYTNIVGTGLTIDTGSNAGHALLAIPLITPSRVPPSNITFSANTVIGVTQGNGSTANVANANLNANTSTTVMVLINASNMSNTVTAGQGTIVYLINSGSGNGTMGFTGCEL